MAYTVSQSTIEEIKARTDIADLISSYGISLKRAGADFKACCPFHHEKTPSFVIHPHQGYYHCFGCGEKGNVFSFVMKYEGLTFLESVRKLAAQCGVTIEEREDPEADARSRLYALHAELAAFFRRCLKVAPEAEDARKYLASRELPEDALESFCVGYAPAAPEALQKWAQKYKFTADEMDAAGVLLKSKYANGRPYNRFGGRLMFTICDRQGRPVAFSGRILTNDKKVAKYVNSPETLIFKKSNVLFGLDKAAPHIVKAPGRCAIVCEGQIDLIRCHSSGFANTVASQGTAFTEEHARMVKKCADSVVLVFDADGAGQKAAIKTGGEFLALEMPVRVATLPPGEDPDSLLRDKGSDAFRTIIDNAESISSFQVRTAIEKEQNPNTIDAVARISRAALETIAKCPSAVLRASLISEAAKLLNVPVAALEEDFKNLKQPRRSAPQNSQKQEVKAPAQSSSMPDFDAIDAMMAADESYFDDHVEQIEKRPDPPSALELALCEFLFSHDADKDVHALMDAHAPDVVFEHDFTRMFIASWREESASPGCDAYANLRAGLSESERPFLDKILLSNSRAGLSELEPARILQDMLRSVWASALKRQQGMLPAASTPENDRLRFQLSSNIRMLQRSPWHSAVKLMVIEK